MLKSGLWWKYDTEDKSTPCMLIPSLLIAGPVIHLPGTSRAAPNWNAWGFPPKQPCFVVTYVHIASTDFPKTPELYLSFSCLLQTDMQWQKHPSHLPFITPLRLTPSESGVSYPHPPIVWDFVKSAVLWSGLETTSHRTMSCREFPDNPSGDEVFMCSECPSL